MRELYLYAERPIQKIVEEMFINFEVHTLSREVFKKNNLTNKNILLVLSEGLPTHLNEFFFLKNKVVILTSKQNIMIKKKYLNTKIFNEHSNISKFRDEITTFYESKPYIYKDIKIWGEKIINIKNEEEIFLTTAERDILTLLFERNQVEKIFLLESVLKIKKDIETKTIESHLTRIRKKLLKINSQIEIVLKDKKVFLQP